jgi:urease accessory protein
VCADIVRANVVRADLVTDASLLLMTWFSPAYPVGAFAYSHGLEWAHEAGDVRDAATLGDWLGDILRHGAARNDAILLAEAYRASLAGETEALAAVAELALALAGSAERRLETVTQGNAFVAATQAAHPCDALLRLKTAWPGDVVYPVAVGVAAAGHGLTLDAVMPAFLHGFAANLVSAAVRLGLVGQTDGQRVLAGLLPAIAAQAASSRACGLDDLGACAFRSDLASLRHETQYSRLFRS